MERHSIERYFSGTILQKNKKKNIPDRNDKSGWSINPDHDNSPIKGIMHQVGL